MVAANDIADLIIDYNLNNYEWPSDQVELCVDEELTQGVYDYGVAYCTISNFFVETKYSCDGQSFMDLEEDSEINLVQRS